MMVFRREIRERRERESTQENCPKLFFLVAKCGDWGHLYWKYGLSAFGAPCRVTNLLEKYMFVSHTKHTQQKINESTSFAIDNMYYVSFRI